MTAPESGGGRPTATAGPPAGRDPRKFYDSIALEFDALMDHYDLDRRVEVVFDELLGGVDLTGMRLLDAGCGTGPFTERARARGADVVSVDIGPGLLLQARRKGGQKPVAADVSVLPFPSASFDVVVSSECIEHTSSPEASVAELLRVLMPGGRLVVTSPNRFWYWSCVVANALNLRPYRGLENWPRWGELRRWVSASADVRVQQGLHLFPFTLRFTHPLLRLLDRGGRKLGPLYVNQCLLAVKR